MYRGTLKTPSAVPCSRLQAVISVIVDIFYKVEIDSTAWWFWQGNRPGGVTSQIHTAKWQLVQLLHCVLTQCRVMAKSSIQTLRDISMYIHVWYNFFETWAKYWPFIDVSVSCQSWFGAVLVCHELEVMTLAVMRFFLKLPMVRECPYFHGLNFTSPFRSDLWMHL